MEAGAAEMETKKQLSAEMRSHGGERRLGRSPQLQGNELFLLLVYVSATPVLGPLVHEVLFMITTRRPLLLS